MFDIQAINNDFSTAINAKIDGKTKPLGALGELELLAKKIALIQLTASNTNLALAAEKKLTVVKPHLSIFAGDHGVAAQGVSIAPSEVTGQMIANFANGGAAINVFCRQFGWHLNVVDAGTLVPSADELGIIDQRLGCITHAINHQAAMSESQMEQGFLLAKSHVNKIAESGCNIIAFGEMGIGNTTVASAIMAAIMNIPAAEAVGRGTGVSDDIVKRKQDVVTQALALHKDHLSDPKGILQTLGGFEVAQITAAMLAAAEHKMLVVVDGFICTASAMLAIAINPLVKEYMVFAHCSGEQGHQKMLEWLNVKPLLNMGLRLGEGTGAALTLPLIEAAIAFYNDMASFEQAEVTNVV